MMWFVFLFLYTAHLEPVKGAVNRLILKDGGENPCEGHIEVYHNDKWGYVGDTSWESEKNGAVVCRSAHCGEHRSTEDKLRSNKIVWLDEVKCIGNESHLWDCPNSGWNISVYRKDSVKKVKCSRSITISLDKHKCAGNVQYTTGDSMNSGYFCAANWGEKEANHVCKSLGCGQATKDKMMNTDKGNWMEINCQGIEEIKNLWHCVTGRQSCNVGRASVICTGHERLQLKGKASNVCSGKLEKLVNNIWKPHNSSNPNASCKHMNCGSSGSYNGKQLTCEDRVRVFLKNNEDKKCYGAVHIKVNDTDRPVCASEWTDKNAEVVCRENGCGHLVSNKPRFQTTKGIMDYVNCSGSESSLWHCWAKRPENPESCSSSAYVVCAGSIKVQLADSPGTCAGRVEIEYEGKWRKVRKSAWTDTNSNLVCTQLGCGKKKVDDDEKFSSGSGDFLENTVSCTADSRAISKCFTDNSGSLPRDTRGERDTAAITCEDHKVVFLKGNNSCSGQVGIEHGKKIYWLSGSKETWNNESANVVCRQTHCGEAKDYGFSPNGDSKKKLWGESYNCTSNHTSLFSCEKHDKKDNDTTIASVTCEGNIKVNLTKGCWGTVNVCVGEKCGGVCEDTWTDKKSVMLCEELGCGGKLIKPYNPPRGGEVLFKSLHATKETTSLSQCNLVEYNKKDAPCQNPAYVVCSGSVKTRINASRDKCSGDVQMRYEGVWLPVCENALKESKPQATICKDLGCGQAVKTINYFGQESKKTRYISKITCDGNDMAGCEIASDNKNCVLSGLRCSNWKRMELKFNRSCGGDVFVHTEHKKSPVSAVGWTTTEGARLCQDLKCGKLSNISTKPSSDHGFWGADFNCANATNPENIWGCEKPTSNKSSSRQLSIQCQDEPKVTLSGGCYGEVRIDNISVCGSHWNEGFSHLVCKESGCSNALEFTSETSKLDVKYRVDCEDYHHKLGQCNRVKEKCDKIVSVYCIGHVKFNTTQRCGGQIQANYGKRWEKVCLKNVSLALKNNLCKELSLLNNIECGHHNKNRDTKHNYKDLPKTSLDCTSADTNHIQYCLKTQQSCGQNDPTEIYCDKYEPPRPKGSTPTSPPVVPIILGVGFVLILVIVIVVFVRVCIVRRGNRPMKASSRMLPRQEVEFESGDYEDVTNKANEMEDFGGRFGFKSEAEVITENDARSTNSLSYDDIDEVAEAQPLTSQVPGAGDTGNVFREAVLDQSSDGVTYEVDDPQENYDDIEAIPENTQTQAEVHNSPQTTPGSETVAPPDFVQGDDDYLVPGEDG